MTVIIPAWNERENLILLLPLLREALGRLGIQWEIVVVDGGSADGTAAAAEQLGARVVLQTERGYGGALLAGFAVARSPYVATMDADLSHPPDFLEDFWWRREEADVLIASRYIPGGKADMSGFRFLLSRILNVTYSRILDIPLRDLSSGFRFYRREAVAGLSLASRDFDVLEEILVKAYNEGWDIREVPFHYMPRATGRSHAKLLQFGRAYLKTIVRMWQLRNSHESADYESRAFDSPLWPQRWWQRSRHRAVRRLVASARRVLDVGCGSSRMVIDQPHAVALDVSHTKLRWLRPRHRLVVQGRAEDLPFPSNWFSAVILSQVLSYLPDPALALREALRVLKPGGTLVVGVPDSARPLWRLFRSAYDLIFAFHRGASLHRFSREELASRLQQEGFEIDHWQYVGGSEVILRAKKPLAGHAAADRVPRWSAPVLGAAASHGTAAIHGD